MRLRASLIGLVGALALAGCDDGDLVDDGILDSLDSLGTTALAAFAAGIGDEPVDAQSVNLPALSLTTDPFNP